MRGLDAIRSAKNPRLKAVRALRAGRERDALLLEGDHLLTEALLGQVTLDWVLFEEGRLTSTREKLLEAARERGVEVLYCDAKLMRSVSDLDTPPGLLAFGRRPRCELEPVVAEVCRAQGWALVAAGIQDPGNMGALVRVAAGFGAGALFVMKGGVSPWHPRALRGAAGTAFRLPLVEGIALDALRRVIESHSLTMWEATAEGEDIRTLSSTGSLLLVVGEEGGGVPSEVSELCATQVGIPLERGVESLNVATAAAVMASHLRGVGR